MPRFYLVDLESITCDEQRSQFSIEQIEDLAQSISVMGSLVKPIILEATSLQTYRLLAGALEYYAAVRASEINPDIEMVDAFVIEPEKIDQAKEQLRALKSTEILPSPTVTGGNTELERRVNNIEVRFDQALQDLRSAYDKQFQALKEKIASLQDTPPQKSEPKSEPLAMFNNLSEMELVQALKKAGLGQKMAQTLTKNLVTARTEQPFKSYSDVVSRTQQLGDKRMLAILDSWSGF